jgi:hypothetical protein
VNAVTESWGNEGLAAVPPGVDGPAVQPDDERLLSVLGRALRARRDVPPEFVQAAKDAFAWHDIDAELAQLTYDSVHGSDMVAPTRAEDASIRALTFTSPRLTIELEITAESLLGQIIPTQVATIEIQARPGAASVVGADAATDTGTAVATDEIGCFTIHPVPRGTFRLRCLAVGGIDVRTGWITL